MNRRLIILISILFFSAAAYILGWSSLFTVSSIEITGSKTQLSSGILVGQKLARVEPREIAVKIEDLDWVASANVSRNWISGKVTITIAERVPVAIYNNTVIDSTGKSFALRGASSKKLVVIKAGDLRAATDAVEFLSSLPEDLKSALTVVKVGGSGVLVLEVNNAGKNLEIRWGNNGDNQLKFKVYKALIALPENAKIKKVDVSAPHAPIVK